MRVVILSASKVEVAIPITLGEGGGHPHLFKIVVLAFTIPLIKLMLLRIIPVVSLFPNPLGPPKLARVLAFLANALHVLAFFGLVIPCLTLSCC